MKHFIRVDYYPVGGCEPQYHSVFIATPGNLEDTLNSLENAINQCMYLHERFINTNSSIQNCTGGEHQDCVNDSANYLGKK